MPVPAAIIHLPPANSFNIFRHTFHPTPLPFRVILGPYPKYQGLNVVNNNHFRAVRFVLAEAKFVVLCGVLRAAGQEHLAKKLFSGWKVRRDDVPGNDNKQPHT